MKLLILVKIINWSYNCQVNGYQGKGYLLGVLKYYIDYFLVKRGKYNYLMERLDYYFLNEQYVLVLLGVG